MQITWNFQKKLTMNVANCAVKMELKLQDVLELLTFTFFLLFTTFSKKARNCNISGTSYLQLNGWVIWDTLKEVYYPWKFQLHSLRNKKEIFLEVNFSRIQVCRNIVTLLRLFDILNNKFQRR